MCSCGQGNPTPPPPPAAPIEKIGGYGTTEEPAPADPAE